MKTNNKNQTILTLSCPDRPGIIHTISGTIFATGANIIESQQFKNTTGHFFMRLQIENLPHKQDLKQKIQNLEKTFQLRWKLHNATHKTRTIIMVSKEAHCLNDLLFREHAKLLPITITGIISNHETLKNLAQFYQKPFYHLPIRKTEQPNHLGLLKDEAEKTLLQITKKHDTELIVLARYMQILSNNLCQQLTQPTINIHHSFLPSFKGAKPYNQAHTRGVKIIGATAHYVTKDLDEGPIIEQEVIRVDHSHSPQELTQLGKDVETRTLAQAIKLHAQQRILLDTNRTVIFK